jgi:hypothetical protein
MSRIPRALAQRIDRLSRKAHRFHRFAHHPLCHEYAGELVQLGGRTRVCRGCLLASTGALLGCALSVVAPVPSAWGWLLGASLLGLLGTIVGPNRAARRRSKVATRFLPALGIAYGCCRALWAGNWALIAGAVVVLAGILALYRRRGPDRTACTICPERLSEDPCRGFAPMVRRERAFRRLADSWLAKAGPQGL